MKTTATCSSNGWCDPGYAERPRYYSRQLITPDDLSLGVDYLLKLQRRHNRLIHGWGVVCGAQVCPILPANGGGVAKPWKVIVKPGYILDPYGREILIDCEVCFDLRKRCITGVTGEACGEKVDPWCSDVFVKPDPDRVVYVAVQYKQIQSRPVRVEPAGCGCNDDQCEFSRWRDAFEICVLDECPESHRGDPPDPDEVLTGPTPDCPDCPSEPWLALAEVKVTAEGEIEWIDNCSCRRIVVSHAAQWRRCEPLELEEVDATVRPGEEGQRIEIRGARLTANTRVVLPRGVVEPDVSRRELAADGKSLTLIVNVEERLAAGRYPVFVAVEDGSARRGTITVEAAEAAPTPASASRKKASLRRPGRKR